MQHQLFLRIIFSSLGVILFLISPLNTLGAQTNLSFQRLTQAINTSPADSAWLYLNMQRQRVSSNHERVIHALNRSTLHLKLGQFEVAWSHLETADVLANSLLERGLVQQTRGLILARETRWLDSNTAYLRAANLLSGTKKVSDCFHKVSSNFIDYGFQDSSFHYLQLAKNQCVKDNNTELVPHLISSTGMHHYRRAQYDSAAFYFKTALELFKSQGNLEGIVRSYGQLGVMYHRQKKFKEAEVIFELEKPLLDQFFNPYYPVANQTRLAMVYSETKRMDSAIVYFERALQEARKYRYPILETNILSCMGTQLTKFPLPGKSGLLCLKQALALSEQLQSQSDIIINNHNIGWYFLEHEALDSALVYYRASLDAAQFSHNLKYAVYAYHGMGSAFYWLKDVDSTLHYTALYHQASDSLQSMQIQQNLAKLQGKHELEIAGLRNEKLHAQITESAQDLRIKRTEKAVLVGFVSLLGMCLGFAYFFQRQSAQLKQRNLAILKAELARKSAEEELMATKLEQFKTHIAEKELLIEEFKSYAESSEKRAQLVERLQANLDWPGFMLEFDLLYPHIFAQLDALPVKLTKNDYRITALIKLGFTNQELTEILCISLSGLKSAKTRLRSKIKPLVPENL